LPFSASFFRLQALVKQLDRIGITGGALGEQADQIIGFGLAEEDGLLQTQRVVLVLSALNQSLEQTFGELAGDGVGDAGGHHAGQDFAFEEHARADSAREVQGAVEVVAPVFFQALRRDSHAFGVAEGNALGGRECAWRDRRRPG